MSPYLSKKSDDLIDKVEFGDYKGGYLEIMRLIDFYMQARIHSHLQKLIFAAVLAFDGTAYFGWLFIWRFRFLVRT